jgi:hypothetical protein
VWDGGDDRDAVRGGDAVRAGVGGGLPAVLRPGLLREEVVMHEAFGNGMRVVLVVLYFLAVLGKLRR